MVILALSGVTNSGKSTLARLLSERFPGSKVIGMDAFFLPEDDPKHVHIESIGHHNWELLTALDMDTMRKEARELARNTLSDRLGILEGFLVLNDSDLYSLCQAKVFIDLPYDVCKARRSTRFYDPPDVPGYFDQVVWPSAVKSRAEALDLNPDLHLLDGRESLDLLLEKITIILGKVGLFKVGKGEGA